MKNFLFLLLLTSFGAKAQVLYVPPNPDSLQVSVKVLNTPRFSYITDLTKNHLRKSDSLKYVTAWKRKSDSTANAVLLSQKLASSDNTVTKLGNSFNGANQLLKLDGTGKLPAIDGSLLTGISGAGTSGQQIKDSLNANAFTLRNAGGTGMPLFLFPNTSSAIARKINFAGTGFTQTDSDSSTTLTFSVPTFTSANLPALTTANDVEVSSNAKGLILATPNGSRWRLQLNDDGTVRTTLVTGAAAQPVTFPTTDTGFGENPAGTWGGPSGGRGVSAQTISVNTDGLFQADYSGVNNQNIALGLDGSAGLEQVMNAESDYALFVDGNGNYASMALGYASYNTGALAAAGDVYWLKRVGSTGLVTSGYTRGGTDYTLFTFPVITTALLYRKIGSGLGKYILNPKYK